MVNYKQDVTVKYGKLFDAAYEKANIWPRIDDDPYFGKIVLLEEIDEAHDDVSALFDYAHDVMDETWCAEDVETIKANAVSAICELMQVIAVCNKYEGVFVDEKFAEGDR